MVLVEGLKNIRNIVSKNKLIIFIVLSGVFLRFYRLEEFATFLGDQGRDAIIIKRIVTLEHLPAIGPPTSVGQVYLGPFYYYFIAPWLLIFKFNPMGLALGVAFLSSIYLLINYFIVKELLDKKIALISTCLVAFSTTLIDFSRFSWNPNLLPFFTLLTVYFLIKALKTNHILFYFLTGAFLSFSLQLHYLALFLIPPILISLIVRTIELKVKQKEVIFNSFLALFSFLFFSLPLLIFDLRHNFLNTKNFINLLKSSENVVTNKLTNLLSTFDNLNTYTFNLQMNKIFLIAFLIALLIAFLTLIRKKSNIRTFFIFFICLLLGTSLYSGPQHPHYFGALYPLYYVIIAYFLSLLTPSLFGNFLILLFLSIFIFFNSRGYYFLSQKGSNQIMHAKKVALFLDRLIENNKFNFAVQPDDWQEDTYLYFLELKGKIPAERRKVEITDQMFIVCGKSCDLYHTPSWNVNMFGKFKITDQWQIDNVKIYKLIH